MAKKQPQIIALNEIVWTEAALERVANAPSFVRSGIYKLLVKRAQERGNRIINSKFVTETRNESMMRISQIVKRFGFEELSMDAFSVAKQRMHRHANKVQVIDQIQDFLAQRIDKNPDIMAKFRRYMEVVPRRGLAWMEEALDLLEDVPLDKRDEIKQAIEEQAKKLGEIIVTPEMVSMKVRLDRRINRCYQKNQ